MKSLKLQCKLIVNAPMNEAFSNWHRTVQSYHLLCIITVVIKIVLNPSS